MGFLLERGAPFNVFERTPNTANGLFKVPLLVKYIDLSYLIANTNGSYVMAYSMTEKIYLILSYYVVKYG